MILFPQQILLLLLSPRLASGEEDPSCPRGFSGYRASDDCTSYFICTAGTLVAGTLAECPPGRQFNDILFVCDDPAHFECGTTLRPTPRPTRKPVVAPPTVSPRPTRAPAARSPDAHHGVEDALHHARRDVDDELFVYESGWSEWRPSTQYRFDGFLQGLRVMCECAPTPAPRCGAPALRSLSGRVVLFSPCRPGGSRRPDVLLGSTEPGRDKGRFSKHRRLHRPVHEGDHQV